MFKYQKKKKTYGSLKIGLSKSTRHSPHPPGPYPEPLDPTALAARLKSWLQKPDVGGSSGSFLLQNLRHPTQPMLSTNSSNSGKIKLRFEEIRRHLDRIW